MVTLLSYKFIIQDWWTVQRRPAKTNTFLKTERSEGNQGGIPFQATKISIPHSDNTYDNFFGKKISVFIATKQTH